MTTTRRRFLSTVAGTASLGLVDVSWLRGLAACVHYFHGDRSPDNPVVQQAREALRKT